MKLPRALLRSLAQKSGKPVGTRFQIRVLAKRFGKRYTTRKRSPIIGPIPLGPKVSADDCDGDGIPNARDSDDDNDLLWTRSRRRSRPIRATATLIATV